MRGGAEAAAVGRAGRGTPRSRVAGMGGRTAAGGRGDVERDPQVQNVEGGKGWHLQPLEC